MSDEGTVIARMAIAGDVLGDRLFLYADSLVLALDALADSVDAAPPVHLDYIGRHPGNVVRLLAAQIAQTILDTEAKYRE